MRSPEWFDVQPVAGHWVVNLGTMLTRWSGGQFKATLHRVVVTNRHKARYSVPFFFEPNLDAPIVPPGEIDRPSGRELASDHGADAVSGEKITSGDVLLELARRDGLEVMVDAAWNDSCRGQEQLL